MSFPEFVIQLMQAYAQLLSAVAWPLVIAAIFVVVWYYVVRTFRVFTPQKRVPITWKGLGTLLTNIEKQQLSHTPVTNKQKYRQDLIRHELRIAQRGVEQQDEKTVLRSIALLSSIAQQDDKQVNQWTIHDDKHHVHPGHPETYLPDSDRFQIHERS